MLSKYVALANRKTTWRLFVDRHSTTHSCYNSPVEARNPRFPSVERESTGEAERRNTPDGELKQQKINTKLAKQYY